MTSGPAPIIVAAEFGGTDFTWLDGLRRAHFPPERNQIAAHLTLFHHLPPSLLAELDTRLNAATRHATRPVAGDRRSRCCSGAAWRCASGARR